jgi:hypothetical protein
MRMSEERESWNMLRIVSVSSVVLLMLILSISSATATFTSVSIGSTDTTVGKSVTLPLMIENADDKIISCATIVLSYNNAIAQVTSVNNSDFDALVNNPDNSQGKTTIVVYQTGAEGLTGNIKIADVTIKAIGVGSSSLNPQIETLKNNVGDNVLPDPISGTFTVKSSGGSGGNGGSGWSTPTPSPSPSPSPTPSANETIPPSPSPSSQPEELGIITVQVGDATVERGELVNITLMIKGVGGEGLSSALINLTYDPKVVKVISVGNSDYDMFMPNIGKGKVRMVGFQTGIEGLKGDIKFAELQVKAVGKVNESSELKLEVKELTDNVGKELKEHEDFEVENGFFSITGEGKTEARSSAIWIWGVVGVVLLVVVIAGVRQYKRKKKRQ